MLRKVADFIVTNTLGALYRMFLQWAWTKLGAAAVLAFIAAYVCRWWEAAPIYNTAILSLLVFLVVIGTLNYIERRRARTRAEQTLAQINTLPDIPDSQAFKNKVRQMYEQLEQEMFWHWSSDETVALYRELERDFPSLKAAMDEEDRKFFEWALMEARDDLRAKGANI